MAKASTSTRKEERQRKKRKLSLSEDELDAATEVEAGLHSKALHSLVDVAPLRGNLLEWYANVHETRAMPWRKVFIADSTPEERAQRAYEVWVSEIMLQQTQVATVIPYYNRWMERFPTMQDLAAADIDTVNSLWKGLGYYSRAARLLSGAQKVVSDFEGYLPADAKRMEKEIPGIGRYSAGAICSIAYGLCVPVLDGNVHRLLSRVLALHSPPKAKKTLDILWSAAEVMVKDSDRPGDVNQALIELGSTVCKVRDPTCGSCPLKKNCGAYKEYKGTQLLADDIEDLCDLCEPAPAGKSVTRFPMKVIKKKSRIETDVVNIVEWTGHDERFFALVRRPEGGLLAGLYEFPASENVEDTEVELLEMPHLVLEDLLATPPAKYKSSKIADDKSKADDRVHIAKIRDIGDTVHVFSHIKKTYRILWVVLKGGSSPPSFKNVLEHKTKKRKVGEVGVGAVGARVKWVLEKEVMDANIGTGVLNVWKKARSVWNSVKD